jgi:hypothetical protein
MIDPWLVGDLGNMMESPQITPAYLAYLFRVVTHRSRPSPPWGMGPAPGEVQECWEQLNSWKSREELTNADLVDMLRDAGAPECQPEHVGGLCGVIGGYMSARARAARLPTSGRKPFERIAAACAELRRVIPRELEFMKSDMDGFPDDQRPMYEREIFRLAVLLKGATIPDRFPRFDDEDVDPNKYDPQAVRLIFFSYEMIYGQSGRSRNGPAVRFIETAIKSIGWHTVGPGAIEQLLRRSLSGRAPAATIS